MKKIPLLVAASLGLTCFAASPLDAVPWIGDGQRERNGADWYDEDPAPEFRAKFVLTAKFAKMLGHDEATAFAKVADKIRLAFQGNYVHDGIVANGTQSAQAIGLYLGLVPSEQIPAAERRLVAAIGEKGGALSTGLFSTRYMLVYLAEHGRNELARKVVLHEGFPGWMHMLERGATTIWETWKESDDRYSNCHPMFGSVDEWILKYANK